MNNVRLNCLLIVVLIFLASSCERSLETGNSGYIFISDYCDNITVGGFVGITEKCFTYGDTIYGYIEDEGFVTIRIAEHTKLNNKEPGPWSYQELMNIPIEYLELVEE